MTNTTFFIIIVAILLFVIVRRKLIVANPNVKNLTAEEANKLLNENKDVFILDVRTKGEYANGHIPGATLIPSTEIASRVHELEKYLNKPILVYCASGGRSPGAVQILVKNNFTEIYHLSRGISSWNYNIKR